MPRVIESAITGSPLLPVDDSVWVDWVAVVFGPMLLLLFLQFASLVCPNKFLFKVPLVLLLLLLLLMLLPSEVAELKLPRDEGQLFKVVEVEEGGCGCDRLLFFTAVLPVTTVDEVGGVVVLLFALRKSPIPPNVLPGQVPPSERISFSSPRKPLKYGITRHSGMSWVKGNQELNK